LPVAYGTFLKHAEFVTKAVSETRPILKGVFHRQDGSLVVTDSHRLYVAKDGHSRVDGAIINPKTGEMIDGNYPDVSRIIPDSHPTGVIHIEDIKQTLEAVNALVTAGSFVFSGQKKLPKNKVVIKICSDDDKKITLKTKNEIFKAEYFLTFANEVEPGFTISLTGEYLSQALALFKATGYNQVDINLYGRLRPFVLKGFDDSLQALILPVRD
jgi:DNA polymerase III sliding clamp (beta) subunit (PCNA family)